MLIRCKVWEKPYPKKTWVETFNVDSEEEIHHIFYLFNNNRRPSEEEREFEIIDTDLL